MKRQKPKSKQSAPKQKIEKEPIEDDDDEEEVKEKFDPTPYLQRGVNNDDIIAMKECFDLFDKDKSGYIDLNEMKALIDEMQLDSAPDKILELTSNLDNNKDNKIDFKEFLNLLSIYNFDPGNEIQLNNMFNKFSDFKDGITVEDLKRMSDLVGENYTQEQLENMIKAADKDRDNALNLHEFKRAIHIMEEKK